ncbi:lysyl-tRNA synthetase [Thermaerobacter marianensis DSM 12885]|uniref:Lysine--tRNA ligase n=1 Tax=Thermaerobacter marianensis (strain ATCC 700841 / DSM 12885 / JCM 10246 / 7p75a) TaxID=644966 RepID=E6SLK3_THEM7|nr:lysine--tRNA ligase [Thermaerobacter marianensis]ADU50270.1 lysyl-tRNA synthetase [Thermaerobacter marianensis DSM 12885]
MGEDGVMGRDDGAPGAGGAGTAFPQDAPDACDNGPRPVSGTGPEGDTGGVTRGDSAEDEAVPEAAEGARLQEVLKARRAKLDFWRRRGVDPFGRRYDTTHHARDVVEQFGQLEGQVVRVAGRVMGLRRHGRAAFADLQDVSGRLQLLARVGPLPEDEYRAFLELDRGDWIGAEGTVIRTRRGEISVEVTGFVLLGKSLYPLPEKWHGLRDVDLRYRQRYVDLVVNPQVLETFKIRSKVIREIRAFLDRRGFYEVETPVLHLIYGGAAARPFITHHNALDLDLYLRIALELHLKRLIVGGMERVYEIGRVFRNEGISTRHNPEFTMLELYQAFSDYEGMMELTEQLVSHVAQAVHGTPVVRYQGQEIDFTPPWRRLSFAQALEEMAGVRLDDVLTEDGARRVAQERALELTKDPTPAAVLDELVDVYVQPRLVQPTFLYDYPVVLSPLARRIPDRPHLTYRFEALVAGMEIANAFSELNDPDDQRQRFEEQLAARARGDEEAHQMDEDYIHALEIGLPATGGLGIGIDRLVMLMTDSPSIRDVILFPLMRPRD